MNIYILSDKEIETSILKIIYKYLKLIDVEIAWNMVYDDRIEKYFKN